jgi:hypothetical protein
MNREEKLKVINEIIDGLVELGLVILTDEDAAANTNSNAD